MVDGIFDLREKKSQYLVNKAHTLMPYINFRMAETTVVKWPSAGVM